MIFVDQNEYLNFLENNNKSGKLWMDHGDLQAVSTYYQIKIHVLTTNVQNLEDSNARWTHISPDARMKSFSPVP